MSAPASAPAGFWPRYAAWSLDAAAVAAATSIIGAGQWLALAESARRAYAAMAARTAEVMADSVLDDLSFGGFAQRLLADPALHAVATTTVTALTALVFGWILAFALLGAVYELGFVLSPWQATPGKRALGLRVTDMDGQALGLGRIALRYFGGGLSWLSLNIGHLLAMAKPEHRALHDRLAGARVVRDGDARMPLWGWAWVLLQLSATLFAMVRLFGAMQATMDAAVYQAGGL
ncbi:RDD family protein [Lysobacter sp. Hz 25]|uniref:RDD family protein n=1 Tax=Lysobacter sp. Hz 25 TaxID=3383698 RepID=UPI0038D3636D